MALTPKDKTTLSSLKGEVVRVLMDFSIQLQRYEIETLLALCEFIDNTLLSKLDTRRNTTEELMYARFTECEVLLRSSKTRDIKKISKDIKSILITKRV